MGIEKISTDECALSFDAASGALVVDWKGYATSAQFRSVSEKILVAVAVKDVRLLLNDTSEMVLIGATDQEWVVNDFMPRLAAAGIRACALVSSKHYFNRVAVATIMREVDARLMQVEFFENRAAAAEWLAKIGVAA